MATKKQEVKNNNNSSGQYGMLSMIAIIVGTVMGSGIFIKNQSLMAESQSVILTCIAWVIGGIVVISMMLAFIEISSMTKLKREQGTFTNWSRRLFGPKTSKFIGVYFTMLFFPLVLATEAVYAGQKLTEVSFIQSGIESTDLSISLNWIIITVVAFTILATAFVVNIIWVKPGKAFASTLSFVKLIPLLLVVLVAVLVVGGVTVGELEQNPIFDANDPTFNGGLDGGFKTILLIMPGVMFAFDGFLYANSLSNETKTPNTFKNSVIIGVAIITTVYLTFSLGTFLIAPIVDGEVDYTINAIFNSMFPALQFMADILIFLIFLSITSATFGYSISSQWAFADVSETNFIKDADGQWLRRNSVGNPYKAGWMIFAFAATATAFFRIGDLVTIAAIFGSNVGDDLSNVEAVKYWSTPMSDFISDFYTLFDFALYSVILGGAIANRFTKKNEVEEVRGFFGFAGFAIVMVSLTSIVFAFSIIWGGILDPMLHGVSTPEGVRAIFKVVWLVFLVAIYFGLLAWVWITTADVSEEEQTIKNVYIYAYRNKVKYEVFASAMENGLNDLEKAYELIDEDLGISKKEEKTTSIKQEQVA